MSNEITDHMPYEGAGFILRHGNDIVLGLRRKKPADAAKDPVKELEYMGGKPDAEDQNDPSQTAFAELCEEIGGNVLDADWRTRTRVIHIFQPFSKKWIWCFVLSVIDTEFERIKVRAALLDDPSLWGQSFAALTGRATPVVRAIDALYMVPVTELARYMAGFAQVPASKNRMQDAKEYRNADALHVTHILDGSPAKFPLRGFNAVMWEAHTKDLF